jgi:5-formyltetrahydrofolate cyclo-ligase
MQKHELRKIIQETLRNNAPFREEKSAAIWNKLFQEKSFVQSFHRGSLMVYLDFGTEVQTLPFIQPLPAAGVVVPFCQKNEIVPIRIFSFDELTAGVFNILEPLPDIVADPQRRILPREIENVLVPALAFDRRGNRLGRGKGYYDRFLKTLSCDIMTIGLAFECQIAEPLPYDEWDEPVKKVITEKINE